MELLKDAIPKVYRVAHLSDRTTPPGAADLKEIEAAARVLSVRILPLKLKDSQELAGAFRAAVKTMGRKKIYATRRGARDHSVLKDLSAAIKIFDIKLPPLASGIRGVQRRPRAREETRKCEESKKTIRKTSPNIFVMMSGIDAEQPKL